MEVLTAIRLLGEAERLQKLQTQLTGGRGKADFTEPPILFVLSHSVWLHVVLYAQQLLRPGDEADREVSRKITQKNKYLTELYFSSASS